MFTIVEGLVKLAGAIAGWLESRQQIESGKARAVREALREAQELVRHARKIDAVLSDGTGAPPNSFCLIDEPIGFAAEDSEQTKRRVVEHDRRLYCLCPDIYPTKAEQMDCPAKAHNPKEPNS